MDITSLQNPKIKQIVKLRDDKRQRQHDGLMLIEGRAELLLALRAGWTPESILTAPEFSAAPLDIGSTTAISVSREVFNKISYREQPDGWLGIFPIPRSSLDDLKLSPRPLILILEAIEKPGNLGAILRTADAARVDAVFVCDARVDLWNPNVVRASRGTICAVQALELENQAAYNWLRSNGARIIAATPAATKHFTDVDMREALAIVLGTEDAGLTPFWLAKADESVKIPMAGLVNSLNVSVAAALLTYEALRQRSKAAGGAHA